MKYANIKKVYELSKKDNIPIIRDLTLEIIKNLIIKLQPKNVLEIGTGIGYSGCVLLANSNCMLDTIEKNKNHFEKAKEVFSSLNFKNRVKLINDDAKNVLKKLITENKKYDFIFLDGAKGQYINYLFYLKILLDKNGVLFCDNIFFKKAYTFDNKIIKRYKTIVKRLQEFLIELNNSKEFINYILDIDDGISISLKN